MTAPVLDAPTAPTNEALAVQQIVLLAQAGDSRAIADLYDLYNTMLIKFLHHRTGNIHLAQDLAGDTWVRALKRLGTFEWRGVAFGAFLITIARNLAFDHFKSGRNRLEVATGNVLDADREDLSFEGNPEAAVITHLANVDLIRSVQQLSEDQQECVVLRYLRGFSVAETAQAMGKNEGAVKALQYRAVRTLARLMAPTSTEES